MKKAFFALMAAAALTLSSCGDPTFDKSNPEESGKAMEEKLSDDKKAELKKAIARLVIQNGLNKDAVFDKIDGKTAEEIIEMAK